MSLQQCSDIRPSGLDPLANQGLCRCHYSSIVASRPSGLDPLANQELGRCHYSSIVASRPSGLDPLANQGLCRCHYSSVVTSRPSGQSKSWADVTTAVHRWRSNPRYDEPGNESRAKSGVDGIMWERLQQRAPRRCHRQCHTGSTATRAY